MAGLVKVFSHVRSGSSLMLHTLGQNFEFEGDLKTGAGPAGHWAGRTRVEGHPFGRLFGSHDFYRKGLRGVYIFRDGRDVALSCWRTKAFLHPKDRSSLSLSDFLKKKLDWVATPAKKARGKKRTIFEHWRDHVASYHGKPGIVLVRFENLVLNPDRTINRVADALNLPRPNPPVPVKALVGRFPNDGLVSGWRKFFGYNDLALFNKIVSRDFYGRFTE